MKPEIENGVQQITGNLNMTDDYVWDLLLRQAYTTAATHIIGFAVAISILLYCASALLRKIRSHEDDDVGLPLLGAVTVSLAVTVFVIVCVHAPVTITCLINPEYWALQQIIGK